MISYLDLEEALQQALHVEGEAVAVGLPLEGVEDPLLPIDQGAVAIGGHPFDLSELWEGHDGAGLWQPAPPGPSRPPCRSAREPQMLLVARATCRRTAPISVLPTCAARSGFSGCTV